MKLKPVTILQLDDAIIRELIAEALLARGYELNERLSLSVIPTGNQRDPTYSVSISARVTVMAKATEII